MLRFPLNVSKSTELPKSVESMKQKRDFTVDVCVILYANSWEHFSSQS